MPYIAVDARIGICARHAGSTHPSRGVIHRAVVGVLAQVVTVPGFKPGFEVGVDHHMRAISERLGLEGEDALPLQQSSSVGPVIK